MSRENVEVVRRIVDAWSRGDFRVKADLLDPDIRIVWLSVFVVGDVETRGIEAATAKMADWLRSWEHVTLTADRIVEAGDRVVLIAVWRARGAESGVATEWRHGQVWALRDGKVIEAISYADPTEALEAAGLSR